MNKLLLRKILLFLFIILFYSCKKNEQNPVIILDPIIENSYKYQNIRFYYKNISNKPISKINIEFIGVNEFNEEIMINNDSITSLKNLGIGISEGILKPNELSTGIWYVIPSKAIKISKATVNKVLYSDGTVWINKK